MRRDMNTGAPHPVTPLAEGVRQTIDLFRTRGHSDALGR
jgi:hypothetical protein